ncbi:uncharacterized protein N7529_000166 [Penicillium soppii]|uniref:uncharacterized protein n=1 Tax=Penicillium soppii TaxID=69789 RepID=UPI002548E1C0|nr:uncharacterized protein N7529_000166 [Penicillium soppii]KAJ5881494.1 hypothetical protein N7529_000166 [Penicillium soppii]
MWINETQLKKLKLAWLRLFQERKRRKSNSDFIWFLSDVGFAYAVNFLLEAKHLIKVLMVAFVVPNIPNAYFLAALAEGEANTSVIFLLA